jgi:hypothetical protein
MGMRDSLTVANVYRPSSQIVRARSIPSSQRANPIVAPGLGQGRGQYEGIVDTFV